MGILSSLFGASVESLKRKKDVEALWQLRTHTSWPMRRDAAIALAHLGDQRGLQYLIAATQPSDPELTQALISALSVDPSKASLLCGICQSGGYGYSSDRVLAALDVYRDQANPEPTVDDLLNSRDGPFWWHRGDLKRLVLPFGARAIDYLVRQLRECQDDKRLQRVIQLITGLGRGAGAAAQPLWDVFRANPDTRMHGEFQTAFLEMYDASLNPAVAGLDDPDERVRAMAANLLHLLPMYARQRDGELEPVTDAERENLRQVAQIALEKALNDASPIVRGAAESM